MTPPCEHNCWRSRPASRPLFNGLGIQSGSCPVPGALPPEGEAACPACQWLAGVEWLRARTGLHQAAIEEGVVTLMRDVVAAVWDAYRSSRYLDDLDAHIGAQEDNMERIFALLRQEPPHA